MEERNLELDDDGKIKLRKRSDALGDEQPSEGDASDDIILDIPDFKGFGEENEDGAVSDEELLRRRQEREEEEQRRKNRAKELFAEGEELFAQGDLDGAGEKFLDSAASYSADWRPWFGVVRVQTKDLTDFTSIYDCEQAYDKALRRMRPEDKAALAEKYAASLEKMAEENAQDSADFTAQDTKEREEARPKIQAEYKKSLKFLIVNAVIFAVFLIASCSLAPFVNTVQGMQILIPAIICGVLAIVFLAVTAVFLRRFLATRFALVKNRRAGTTAAGEQARIHAETEELIRSILEDLQKE